MQILQCEEDLENFLKLKPEQNLIPQEGLLTLYQKQEQVLKIENERFKHKVFESENDLKDINSLKLEDWGKQENKFPRFFNRFFSWKGEYQYSRIENRKRIFGRKLNQRENTNFVRIESATLSYFKEVNKHNHETKKNYLSNYFGSKNNNEEFVKIESVAVSFSKEYSNKQKHDTKEEITDNSANLEPENIKFDASKVSEGEIPEVGNYEIIESNFEEGIFRWKFHPHESFNGTVNFSFEVDAKNTTKYMNQIKELNYIITDCKKELKTIDD